MLDVDRHPDPTDTAQDETVEKSAWASRLPRFVWAGVSVVFLAWLAIGSVEARIWNFGRLNFREKGIAHVWAYFGDHLPDMPGGALFPALYYLSLGVLIVGTIIGLGLFLLSDADGSRDSAEATTSTVTND